MPERHAPKPGTRHLLLRNVPADDLRALAIAAASAEPRTTPTELIRGLVHREAERLRALAAAGPVAGYKFELTISDPKPHVNHANLIMAAVIELAEEMGVTVGGGFAQVDADGNPLTGLTG